MDTSKSLKQLIAENVIVALSYWGISQLNFMLFNGVGILPMPIWPAAALALIASFYRGFSIAPGIAIGTILTNHFALGSTWPLAFCISIMNTLAPVMAAYYIRKILTPDFIIKSTHDILVCFAFAVVFIPLLSASGGIFSKYALGLMDNEQIATAFAKWFMANALGILFFAPPVFVYLLKRDPSLKDTIQHSSKSSCTECIVIELTFFLSIFFWLADSVFEALWFPLPGLTFFQYVFPTHDMHELFMRLMVIMTFVISGFSVYKVIQILLCQQKEALGLAKNLSITLDSIGDGVISADAKGIITHLNPIAEQLTGWKQAEAKGKNIDDIFTLIDASTNKTVPNPIYTAIKTREKYSIAQNTILISNEGKRYFIADSASPILTNDNELLGAILVFRNITEELEIQERLQHSQRMDAIGKLAGGVAHDFNNMLGGIMGFAELLTSKVNDDPEASRYVNMILDTAEKASTLSAKLLTFARKEIIPSTSVNMHNIITASIELLKRTIDKRIAIKTDLAANEYYVIGDPTQLQNIFINMGINAAHAMTNSGEILISSRNIILDADYCNESNESIRPGTYIRLKITDNGCGITPENLQRIFEPFFTTRSLGKGTGLGLAAVYGTIRQHNGEIAVTSKVREGTTFTVQLPIAEKPVQDSESEEEETRKGNARILIADDEHIMRATAKSILERSGHTVTTSTNGAEAFKLYQENPENFDLVILDMMMPVMNGKDCFEKIRMINPDIKIILSSGFARDHEVSVMKEHGLNYFIAKPFRSSALIKAVEQTLQDN